MMQAKQVAIRNANEMIADRLSKAKFAYEEELEFICNQFEEMQEEVKELK